MIAPQPEGVAFINFENTPNFSEDDFKKVIEDGKVNKLFFSPMEPDSKKDEKLIVNITPGYTQTYDDEQGRDDQHKKNFSVTTISTNDGYKALVNTDIVPDGMALSKTAHTRLRTIPRNDSIFPFLFLYHYICH